MNRAVFLILVPTVVGHLLLPAWLLARVWISSAEGWVAWLAAALLAGSYIGYLYVVGVWSWFGEVVRRLWPILYAPVLAASSVLILDHPKSDPAVLSGEQLFRLGLAVCLVIATLFALGGSRLPLGALALNFPLRGGNFRVAHGGASRVINHHFAHLPQRYALDIVQLNKWGIRARGLYPKRLEDYAIWGSEVVSPGDGIVVSAVDGLPDLAPPHRDPAHPPGNYVALEIQGTAVYLAHLKQHSVAVQVGQRVTAGQLIGAVGNSGNTTEPHLHIHVEARRHADSVQTSQGVAMLFDGKFLVRNRRVVVP